MIFSFSFFSFLGYHDSSYSILVKRNSIYIQYMDCKASYGGGLCGNFFFSSRVWLILIAVSILWVYNCNFKLKLRCFPLTFPVVMFLFIYLDLIASVIDLRFCHLFLFLYFFYFGVIFGICMCFIVILSCIINIIDKNLFTILCSCMQCSFICLSPVFYFLAGRASDGHACGWTWNGDPLYFANSIT